MLVHRCTQVRCARVWGMQRSCTSPCRSVALEYGSCANRARLMQRSVLMLGLASFEDALALPKSECWCWKAPLIVLDVAIPGLRQGQTRFVVSQLVVRCHSRFVSLGPYRLQCCELLPACQCKKLGCFVCLQGEDTNGISPWPHTLSEQLLPPCSPQLSMPSSEGGSSRRGSSQGSSPSLNVRLPLCSTQHQGYQQLQPPPQRNSAPAFAVTSPPAFSPSPPSSCAPPSSSANLFMRRHKPGAQVRMGP